MKIFVTYSAWSLVHTRPFPALFCPNWGLRGSSTRDVSARTLYPQRRQEETKKNVLDKIFQELWITVDYFLPFLNEAVKPEVSYEKEGRFLYNG